MVKIIFLDIDGVVNSDIFYSERYRKSKFTFQYWWWKIKRWAKWVLNGFEHKAVSLKPDKNFEKKWKTFQYRFDSFTEDADMTRLRWLDSICEKTKAKIVVSSSHRTTFNIEEWNKVFAWLELENIDVVGVTPYFLGDRMRGFEIKAYLDKHKEEIENYIILDDDHDILPEQFNNFFPTDPYCGLSPKMCARIERHFNKQTKYLCGVALTSDGI